MEKWYFTGEPDADMFSTKNYSNFQLENKQLNKLHSILATNNGNGQPVIDVSTLSSDFIRAVTWKVDYGIVILNDRYKKKQNRISKFIDRLIARI